MTYAELLKVRLGDHLPGAIEKNPDLAKYMKAPDPNCKKCYGRGHAGLFNGQYLRCNCTRKR